MKLRRGEIAGIATLVALWVFVLARSWRKWPDLIIDFGRELYTPWRLSEGAVLYRDVDDFYGPLSQYFNAGLFSVFGPSLMVLVVANLIIFAAIATGLYLLFRRAWGSMAALVAIALFVSVFGFSQFQAVGNANYATPYAHETTHGMLIIVLLVWALLNWIERATTRDVLLAGFLTGLTAVLKPEFMLAGALLTIVAVISRQRQQRTWIAPTSMAHWLMAALLPSALFLWFFSTKLPLGEALDATGRAWLNVFRYGGEFIQARFLGFDQPWHNLWVQFTATVFAAGLLLAVVFGARRIEQLGDRRLRYAGSAVLIAAVAGLVWRYVNWYEVGRCLLGLIVAYLGFKLAARRVTSRLAATPAVEATRVLLGVLALALLTRMLLHGRITQYGFYQAAVAAMMIPAVTINELPEWFGLGLLARRTVACGCVVIIGIGVLVLLAFSNSLLQLKTRAIGDGRDMFYTYGPESDPIGQVAQAMLDQLPHEASNRTLLVLPEGLMLNYLARERSPLAPCFYFSVATENGRETQLVQQLDRAPPTQVVLISRGLLAEYGITRYGEAPGKGQQILQWVEANYEPVASIGRDPLRENERAAILFSRRAPK